MTPIESVENAKNYLDKMIHEAGEHGIKIYALGAYLESVGGLTNIHFDPRELSMVLQVMNELNESARDRCISALSQIADNGFIGLKKEVKE